MVHRTIRIPRLPEERKNTDTGSATLSKQWNGFNRPNGQRILLFFSRLWVLC